LRTSTKLADKVYAVYEDGPLGYVLYRSLRELGVEAYVSARKSVIKGTGHSSFPLLQRPGFH